MLMVDGLEFVSRVVEDYSVTIENLLSRPPPDLGISRDDRWTSQSSRKAGTDRIASAEEHRVVDASAMAVPLVEQTFPGSGEVSPSIDGDATAGLPSLQTSSDEVKCCDDAPGFPSLIYDGTGLEAERCPREGCNGDGSSGGGLEIVGLEESSLSHLGHGLEDGGVVPDFCGADVCRTEGRDGCDRVGMILVRLK
ncbi:hypothetical protein Dimus_017654 [Dionaea muscipula]